MNNKSDDIERLSRDTRPQPAWQGGHPATPRKAALLLALALLAAGCHDLAAGRSSDDDPHLALERAILAECRPGAESPPPGFASRTTDIELRCGDNSRREGVPIEGRALNALGLRSFGKPADPADVALVRPYLAHTNADVRAAAVRVLEGWFADVAVPFPADDPALPADLEAAAAALAAAPAPPLSAADDDTRPLRRLAAAMRATGPLPERPFAVLTNDLGRLECWQRLFLVDANDSSLRRVQELLGVRYGGRDADPASPTAIRARWLLAPAVSPDGISWHAAVGPRLDRLVPREWNGCLIQDPTPRPPAATLAGGAAADLRLDDLPAYGGVLDWEALSFREDESLFHPQRRTVVEPASNDGNGFRHLSDFDRPEPFRPAAVDLALRPDPATPDGVILSVAQIFAIPEDAGGPVSAPATNVVLRDEVPLRPGQTALFGMRTETNESHCQDRRPILSDIPLIGGLFTSESVSTNAFETLLLVRYTPATKH